MSFDPQPLSTVWTTDGHVRCDTPWLQVAGGGLLAAAFFGGGLASPGAGRILLWLVAGVIAAVALRDGGVRPTLATDEIGVRVVRTWRSECLPWAEIERISAYEHRRGLTVRALEIDAGDRLVLLPARRLGAPLEDVVEALREVRATRGRRATRATSPEPTA